MARGWNACALLVLAASALLTVCADLLTTDQIQGMIDSNCLYTSNPPAGAPVGTSHGLDHAGCVSCIKGFTTTSSTGADGAKVEACFNVCQDPQNQLPGLTLSNAAQCVDCLTAANRDICSVCLSLTDSSAATDCMAYWGTGGSSITVADTTAEAAYVWAVGECFKYPTTPTNVRASCLSCLEGYAPATDDAQYFGKCIDAQQQLSYIAEGEWAKVNGIYAMCGAPAYLGAGLTSAECYTCMTTVEATIAATTDSDLQLLLEKKSYGCAQYCMPEVGAIAGSSEGTTLCTECLAATTPADAWACGNCASVPFSNGAKQACYDCVKDDPYEGHTSNFNWACAECSKIQNTQLRALCMQCIRSQPPYGAKPTDPTDTTSDAYKTYLAFTEQTEANICSCVDLTFHAGTTDQLPGVITVSVNRTLDAFELKCFMPQYTYDANGNLQSPTIPWGDNILPYYGLDGKVYVGDSSNEPVLCTAAIGCTVNGGPNPAYGGPTYAPTTACVECVDSTYRVSAPLYPKQYACSEYCQDPATILPDYSVTGLPTGFGGPTSVLVSEGQDCSVCVQAATVLDPSDCKGCIQATNQFTGEFRARRRKQCFNLVMSPRGSQAPATSPVGKRSLQQTTAAPANSYGWAATQCSQFVSDVAFSYCDSCLRAGCEDPCQCVNDARSANGTAYVSPCEAPPSGGGNSCNYPEYLWFWTWVPRYCNSDAGPCSTKSDWYPREISTFNWKIKQRTTPDASACKATGGTPTTGGCHFKDVYPTSGDVTATMSQNDNLYHVFTVSSELYDKTNENYYDVVAIRLNVSDVPWSKYASCIGPDASTTCEFFLVVSQAQAIVPAGQPSNPYQGAANDVGSIKNYTPYPISWDNSQAGGNTTNNEGTGFQDNTSPFAIYNGISIELDSCGGQLLYSSLSPYPTTSSQAGLWQGGPDGTSLGVSTNTVFRMFTINQQPYNHPNGVIEHDADPLNA